jgi:hypothetical protein
MQAPATHDWPGAHAFPALPLGIPQPAVAPQWPASLAGSTQLRLQATNPAPQVVAQ